MNAVGSENDGENGGAVAAAPSHARRNIGLALGGALILAAIGYGSYRYAKPAASHSEAAKAAAAEATAPQEIVTLYARAPTRIYDRPGGPDAAFTEQALRAEALEGYAIPVEVEEGDEPVPPLWFKLADDRGYVLMTSLVEAEPPKLSRVLGDRLWRSDTALDLRKGPATSEPVTMKAAKGTPLTLVGVTAGDYLEVRGAKGLIGYVAGANMLLRRMAARPIAIAFNPATCVFSGEIGSILERVSAKTRAEYDAADQREYPTEEARNTALGKLEGRSSYQRVERSFEGLTLTAIGLHYESHSLYFADPPEKVIEAFRAKGFRIDRAGNFPSTELYAGIAAAQGDARRYGATDLGCGV